MPAESQTTNPVNCITARCRTYKAHVTDCPHFTPLEPKDCSRVCQIVGKHGKDCSNNPDYRNEILARRWWAECK